MNIGNCDKCGLPVPQTNDAVYWHVLAYGDSMVLLWGQSRHLYPTIECEGSPSRVKGIEENADLKAAYIKLQTHDFTKGD